jgi:predicted transcriptional regulator
MSDSTVVSVRLDKATKARLDKLAAATRRSKSFLAGEAITAYVERELAIVEGIQEGLEDMKAGRVVPHEDAMAVIAAAIEEAKSEAAE